MSDPKPATDEQIAEWRKYDELNAKSKGSYAKHAKKAMALIARVRAEQERADAAWQQGFDDQVANTSEQFQRAESLRAHVVELRKERDDLRALLRVAGRVVEDSYRSACEHADKCFNSYGENPQTGRAFAEREELKGIGDRIEAALGEGDDGTD